MNNNKEFKVYELQTNGESQWMCAKTLVSALFKYEEITGVSLEEWDEEDDVVIVPKSKWKDMKILNPDEEDENGEMLVIQTFDQYMSTANKVDMIASTVY